ncbi:hypothetical protein Bpfe_007425 [Biomphalaria pfeifferi]|uniref:CUB domain-containing protein n=1 Tax=Biomphalaria pfeifferi TaxID=112525 RepID=A0AAD8FHD5_BIOPF|nr:hypothetical protein Bpfe_007425 [Biomphalaria pfeifferi]
MCHCLGCSYTKGSILCVSLFVLAASSAQELRQEEIFFPETLSLRKYCGKHLKVYKAMRVELKESPLVSPCILQVSSTNGSLLATFVNLYYRNTYIRCDETIQLCSPRKCFFENDGYCGEKRPQVVYNLDSNGTLTYTYNVDDYKVMTFTILFTEALLRGTATGGCPNNLFDCSSAGICIDPSLACNKNEDCPDGEDELDYCWVTTLRTLVFLSVILIVPGITFSGVYYIVKKMMLKKVEKLRYTDIIQQQGSPSSQQSLQRSVDTSGSFCNVITSCEDSLSDLTFRDQDSMLSSVAGDLETEGSDSLKSKESQRIGE